jgi:hypothetical protein
MTMTRNMPSTKLPKALSACDVVIRERKEALAGEGTRIILEGDAADSYLRGLITQEEGIIKDLVDKRQVYINYQKEHLDKNDKVVIPEVLEVASEATLRQAKELMDLAHIARARRGGKLKALRTGDSLSSHTTSSKGP